ncbi:hypothetical protein BG003_004613 [Podila horticola]|nr:hypothetical protein BG003_004613 [Podila horticola]
MTTPEDRQRTHYSAKEDTGVMLGVNPRATTFDSENRKEQEEEATSATEDTQRVLQEEWGHDKPKRVLEILNAFPLAAPAVPLGSGLADMTTSKLRHHQDRTSNITSTTECAKGEERAETPAGTKDSSDSIHDDRIVETDGTLSKPKRKYTKRKKVEDDTEAVTEISEPAKKQTRIRAFTAQSNGKRTGEKEGEADTEVDASGETVRAKPTRKKPSTAATTSKGKQKSTTKDEDDTDTMEAGRAATNKATPSQTGATRGRARGMAKNTKADAVDGEEREPLKTRKKRTKASTSEGKGKDKATTKKANDGTDDEIEGGEPMAAKDKCRRKAIAKRGSNKKDENAKAEELVFPSVETNRCPVSKRKSKARANDDDEDANEHALVPINPSDPCSLFPTEMWHMVLDRLPLSQIARMSSVNNGWLTGARSYRGWATAAACGKMGAPKIKYKTFMALVCSRSYFVCDRCLSYSTGKDLRSRIPLAVPVNGNAANTWLLCHDCRREYYRKHPERLRPPCNSKDKKTYVANARICKTSAMWDYWLDAGDIAGLQFDEYDNPHNARGHPMRLYDELVVQKRAYRVHAGWVGLDGAKANVPKSRRAAHRAREESNKLRRIPKREKSEPAKTPEAQTLDQHSDGGHGLYESDWEDFFDDNFGEGPSNQFGNL